MLLVGEDSGRPEAGGPAVMERTTSLCQGCRKRIPAELFERAGDVWMRKTCPEHGPHEALYWRDASLYKRMHDVVGDYAFCTTHHCLDGVACDRCVEKAYNIVIDFTNRCNLQCPVCFADANNPYSVDPSVDDIIARLPKVKEGFFGRLRRPNISILGGEPTARKELPELIRRLCALGYIPRVSTNGVRMTNDAYLEELWNAGLRWVILQFDGFDDDVSERLRGERLHEKKLEAIRKLTARGFKVQLGTMMVRGLNTKYAGDIIRFVGRHEKLFWMSFYPNSAQSRFDQALKDTHVADMYAEIERTTGGRITADDFVASMRLFAFAHKILRTPNLQQKMSTTALILLFRGDEFFPLVRLRKLSFALRNLDMVGKLLLALPKLLWFQTSATPSFVKFLVVEKFHSEETIDLQEASNCHMSFMTRWSYPPFDLYNIAAKKRGSWEPVEEFRERMRKRGGVAAAASPA
jgi:uncharacterized radical SAM superfamily Fe-S cluster-containing enzyme